MLLEREDRRAMIEAAPVELVERDGRTWLLRKLPQFAPPTSPAAVRLRAERVGA